MSITIYKVETFADLEKCLNIRYQVFTLEKGVPKDIEVDRFDNMESVCDHFLILKDNEPCGTLRCMNVDDSIKVQRFCILKDFRNFGIGKTAMEFVEEYYKKIGKTKIQMDSKYSVYKFYEKCGYKQVSDVFIEANIEHIKMIKEL